MYNRMNLGRVQLLKQTLVDTVEAELQSLKLLQAAKITEVMSDDLGGEIKEMEEFRDWLVSCPYNHINCHIAPMMDQGNVQIAGPTVC